MIENNVFNLLETLLTKFKNIHFNSPKFQILCTRVDF